MVGIYREAIGTPRALRELVGLPFGGSPGTVIGGDDLRPSVGGGMLGSWTGGGVGDVRGESSSESEEEEDSNRDFENQEPG